MPNAHEGDVSWERAKSIRTIVSNNVPTSRHHGAAKHGNALLAGPIRCRRCGRKLTLRYTGAKRGIPRYSCSRAWMDNGEPQCIAFGGLRVDDAIKVQRDAALIGPEVKIARHELAALINTDCCRTPTSLQTLSRSSATSVPPKVNRGTSEGEKREKMSMTLSARSLCPVAS